MSRRDDDYKFQPIADARASINQRVNLIGAVTDSSLPKKSRGTDCFVSLRIIDESRSNPGISVNFFTETMDKLPNVMTDGDIIQLSHVVMKANGPDVYVLYNKKFSSFALYEGKHSTSFTPYQCSDKFHAREQDKKFILGLRKWLAGEPIDGGAASVTSSITRSADILQLSEFREGIRFNLVCKVLHACEIKRDEWMLFVWDGTDTPPAAIKTKLEAEMENPLPLQLEPIPLSRDVLCTFPHVGTVLRVTVDSGNEKIALNCITTGRWVKLSSLRCEVRSSLWCAVLMPFSRLCYLSDDNDLVLERKGMYGDRLSAKWGQMPLTSFPWHSGMTGTSYPNVPFTTLMYVLTYPEVICKFRCTVRVVAALPWRVSDFRSPSGAYRIRLTLEDPTARIHAFLYEDDAEEFVVHFPSADELTRKWNLILGAPMNDDHSAVVGDASRNPPWIECCLKSYYIDKSDIWGSRNYKIFATTLLPRL